MTLIGLRKPARNAAWDFERLMCAHGSAMNRTCYTFRNPIGGSPGNIRWGLPLCFGRVRFAAPSFAFSTHWTKNAVCDGTPNLDTCLRLLDHYVRPRAS